MKGGKAGGDHIVWASKTARHAAHRSLLLVLSYAEESFVEQLNEWARHRNRSGKAEKKHWPSDALVTLFRYHLARASLGRVSRGLNPNFSRRLRRGSTATRPEGVFAMAC